MVNPASQETGGSVVFTAKVVPGSSRTCLCGLLNGMVKVKISAAPEKGKANQCLIAFLAKQLGVKKNAVTIVSGAGNPIKQVRVAGITSEALSRELGLDGLGR
jgi:uncharacterized protein (TIGR00251 family)